MYTVSKAKKAIEDGIRAYLEKDNQGNYLMKEVNCLPFFLEGAPGIGKTEIVKQIADEMKLGFVSFSLVHHTRNSLLGLPVISELENGDKYTKYTMSEIIAKVKESVEEGHLEGILLLDEFPCMSESIVPAMLSFLQTKNIGAHTLPRGWVMVLCGNPAKYNKASRHFDAAVNDRVRKIPVEYGNEDFLNYANIKDFNRIVIDFLEHNPDYIYRFSTQKDKEELVTCRGWENLSIALALAQRLGTRVDQDMVYQFVKSEEIASRFVEFYRQQCCGMSLNEKDQVFAGRYTEKIIQKYESLSFDKQWNMTAFLLGFIKQEAELQKDKMKVITCLKQIVENLKKSMKKKNADFYDLYVGFRDIAVYSEHIYKNSFLWSELFPTEAFDLDESLEDKVYEVVRSVVALTISEDEELVESGIDGYEILVKKYLKGIQNSIKTLNNRQKECQIELSNKLNNTFEFLENIDGEGTLSEKLYLEISGDVELLKAVCIGNCKAYEKMCKKQYGTSGIA